MTDNYEIHITVHASDLHKLKTLANVENWTTSCIDGDDALPHDTYGYLTTHRTNLQLAILDMQKMAGMVRGMDIKVLREKIEHVIFDRRES